MIGFSRHTSPEGQIKFFFDICFCTRIWQKIHFYRHFSALLEQLQPRKEKRQKNESTRICLESCNSLICGLVLREITLEVMMWLKAF